MFTPDSGNQVFQTALAFVNQTSRHLFLTGKAGTGKTTFLKYIKEHSFKKMVVVAPTGVAAINAGGVTIHSFFQIPPGTFLPTNQRIHETADGKVNNLHTLFQHMRMGAAKRDLIRELDLLVIDEISMVRADLLDAMDAVLRHVRRKPAQPFGGVQVLYIGDLFQLSPVVANGEWNLLKPFYRSPFFFDARVIAQASPLYLELRKIYRQSDDLFINILNNIRNNCCDEQDLAHLHQHYDPGFIQPGDEKFITLTTHNEKAEVINARELRKLPGPPHVFKAEIRGEFSDRSFPADESLQLKEGAQVMFIKNDTGEFRKYFNGKLAIVESLSEEEITVSFPGEKDTLSLNKETWQNIRYHYNQEKDGIDEEELGSFSQYPIRLAWAITIHKSQGLTFEKAIIDAGESFAPGQVYVALSRLTSMKGMVLRSRIHRHAIHTDERVLNFVQTEPTAGELELMLREEQRAFMRQSVIEAFGWQKLEAVFASHLEGYEGRALADIESGIRWTQEMIASIAALDETGKKFQQQLLRLFAEGEKDGYEQLKERTAAACDYFTRGIDDRLLQPMNKRISNVSSFKKVKKYSQELAALKIKIERKKQEFGHVLNIVRSLHESGHSERTLQAVEIFHKPIPGVAGEAMTLPKKKREKGESHRISLEMFRQGKPIPEIAKERDLSPGTIEGHLVHFIPTGEVDVLELISEPKLQAVLAKATNPNEATQTSLKQQLGDEFSWTEIRAALKFREKTASVNTTGLE